jgi:polysaccharide biosynthesis transport protein
MLGALAGVVLTAISDAEYASRADVFVTAPSEGTADDAVNAAQYSQDQATNFAELATRQVVLLPVIDELGLDTTSSDLRSQLTVSVPLGTSLISIRAVDTDAERSADIANAVAESLADVVADLEDDAPVSLQTVEEALPASSASSPRPVLNVLVGVLAGICLGVGAVAVRDAAAASERESV